MPNNKPSSSALNTAIRLLARREHGAQELIKKLQNKGCTAEDAQKAILICQERNYQSDERFCEQFCRLRVQQGYGPLRIEQELQARGIEAHHIERVLYDDPPDWENIASQVIQKKTKGEKTSDIQTRLKIKRFLYYRGFPAELVHKT